MNKKLLKLLLLLVLVVLLGVMLLQEKEEDVEEVKNYTWEEKSITVLSSPTYQKYEVLGMMSNEVKTDSVPVKNLPREERKEYYKELVEQYEWHHGVALAIIREESQYGRKDWLYNPEKHRGCRGSYGAMQMGCVHIGNYGLTMDNIYDPEANVRAAYLLWKEQGFRPWGVCKPPNQKVVCWL